MEMDYERLLKEFRDTVTAAISTSNTQVSQKLDNVLDRINGLERSIFSLETHKSGLTEKISELQVKSSGIESRIKEVEEKQLTMQVQNQSLGKVFNVLVGILAATVSGLLVWWLKGSK